MTPFKHRRRAYHPEVPPVPGHLRTSKVIRANKLLLSHDGAKWLGAVETRRPYGMSKRRMGPDNSEAMESRPAPPRHVGKCTWKRAMTTQRSRPAPGYSARMSVLAGPPGVPTSALGRLLAQSSWTCGCIVGSGALPRDSKALLSGL